MRMQTTKHLLFLALMLVGLNSAFAQNTKVTKVKVVSATVDTIVHAAENTPIIAGLPTFVVNFETSLRVLPDHRSGIQTRLFPGTEVKVLDPYNYVYWTKVKVGDKIGWAKKACLDPKSGEIDHSKLLEEKSADL